MNIVSSTRWLSWLRHFATNRKVQCSIPDGVTGIFHWHNPSSRTMALGPTLLTEMSTRNISWGVMAATSMCRLSWNLGTSPSWKSLGLSRPVMGLLYLYIYTRITRLRVVPLSASPSIGTVDSFPRNKAVVTWSYSSIAEVKNAWSYTSIHVMALNEAQDKF